MKCVCVCVCVFYWYDDISSYVGCCYSSRTTTATFLIATQRNQSMATLPLGKCVVPFLVSPFSDNPARFGSYVSVSVCFVWCG
mmetsp:Transcript_27822/g.31989  ORF Transcript_27822/g.31989 Transcript_27822/m.31989 type:complete len:83 (-) Transcript_27822:1852-2100(-)